MAQRLGDNTPRNPKEEIAALKKEIEELEEENLELQQSAEEINPEVETKIREDYLSSIINGDAPDALKRIASEFPDELIKSQWVKIDPSFYGTAITQTTQAIAKLVEELKKSNASDSPEGFLKPVQRQQLIVVLKAALVELEAPYVDRTRFRTLSRWVGKIGKRAVNEKSTEAMKDAFDDASQTLGKLAKDIFNEPPTGIF